MVHKILSMFVLENADHIEIIKDLVAYPSAYRVRVIRKDRQVYWTYLDRREVGYLMNEANRYNMEYTIKD